MGATVTQQFAPAQRAGFFYNPAAPIPTGWRNRHSLFVLGRQNPFGNPGQNEAANAGAIELIYFDTPLYYKGGVYDSLFFNANSYGAAIGSMGGGTSYGPAADILSNTAAVTNKMEAVWRKIHVDLPLARGIFCDDTGPGWAGYAGFSAPTRESVYLALLVICARMRSLADELGLMLMANGVWGGDMNQGYPVRATHGCSYMDNFCIEKHAYSEAAFWRAVMAGQWRLRDSAGFRGHLHITTNATLTSQWGSEANVGWIAEQGSGLYDTNPSTAVATRTPHDLGLSFTGATPTISVAVAPQNVTLQTGATQQFTATVVGAVESPIWYVNGIRSGNATVGTIGAATGLYTAPASVPSPATVTVSAQLVGGQSGSSPVAIQAAPPAPPPTGGTPPTAPAAIPGTIADGNRFVGTTPNSGMAADTNRGCLVFWDQAGTITSVSALVDGLAVGGVGTQPIRYAIYADSAGEPGALLGYTVDGTVTAGDLPSWKALDIVTPFDQAPGPIHLHIHSGLNVVARYWFTTNTGVSRAAADTFVGGPIDPFSGASTGDADISIFATATPIGTTAGGSWADNTQTPRSAGALEANIRAFAVSGMFDAERGYGVKADGTTDDSTALQAAIDAAAVAGGRVQLPAGTIIAAGLIMKSNVLLQGHGPGATVLKLKSSANTDLMTVANFSTLAAGTTTGGALKWGLRDLTLDGNKVGNTSGWPLRVYGASYLIDNVEVKDGKSGGVWSQWGTGGTDMEAHWSGFRIHDCAGDGLSWHGPHDSSFVNGKVFKNAGKGILTVGPATSEQFTNVHVWGTEHTHAWHLSSPIYAVNCVAEGATTANLVLDCNFGSWLGGEVFGTNTGAEVGIQFGDAATARYWDVFTRIYNFAATGKPLNYVSTSRNHVRINLDTSTGTTQAVYGTPSSMDHLDIWCGNDPSIATAASDLADNRILGNTSIYNGTTRGLQMKVFGGQYVIAIAEGSSIPAAPANTVNIGAVDNGSGKTLLQCRFATGAAITLATEA